MNIRNIPEKVSRIFLSVRTVVCCIEANSGFQDQDATAAISQYQKSWLGLSQEVLLNISCQIVTNTAATSTW